MKFFNCALVSVISVAAATEVVNGVANPQTSAPLPKTLETVYGVNKRTHSVRPFRSWADKNVMTKRPTSYKSMRSGENCSFPLDVMLLVDATASTQDNRDIIVNQELPKFYSMLEEKHPNSRLGLMSFKDKPIPTLGWEGDYCERLDNPLAAANLDEIQAGILALWPNGGGDPAENQFGAIIDALQNPAVGWEPTESRLSTRVMIVMTDSWPHFADDGLNAYGLTEYEASAPSDTRCTKQYYPSPELVRDIQQETETYMIFLVFDADYAGDQPINSWRWFNEFIEQPSQFVDDVSLSSESWWEAVSSALGELVGVECDIEDTTSTTEEPTTSTTEETTTSPTEEPKDSTTGDQETTTLPMCVMPTTAEVVCEDPVREVVVVKKNLRYI
jgi:hypothetical protein